MLKNTLISMMVLSSLSIAEETVNDKNWHLNHYNFFDLTHR